MNSHLFEQNFVYCNVCHRRHSHGDPLNLTSCAHILCSLHVENKHTCPVCDTDDISIIKLAVDKNLPPDVISFFEPLPNLLETIYNVSQFQQQALVNQIQYYQTHCVKLREKVARQQQLLYKAKQELDGVSKLRNRIIDLESQLKHNNTNSQGISKFFDSRNSHKASTSYGDDHNIQPPMTVDLTMDDSENDGNTFLSKLKKKSSIRNHMDRNNRNLGGLLQTKVNFPNVSSMQTTTKIQRSITDYSSPSDIQKYAPNNNVSTNEAFEAESTHLAKYIYSPNNGRTDTKDNRGMGISSLSSLSTEGASHERSSLTYSSSNNNQTKNRNSYINTNRNKFPQALDRLRITKRNNTINNTNNESTRSISNSQGIIAHMRSSRNRTTTNNINMNKNNLTQNRRSSTSQVINCKYPNTPSSNMKYKKT
ncbi:similar to Saccharomyces cerevisiae YLR394W CST9 SUMO E3 ligase [Maudiozyma barnettii]|uniref:Similar to Saccharomyces cerevisiae YLR394W CST9 SUMO E3 ligase n=1 Tax=Maudiozyma barnettii TaxID=61262 RepID=A0A8H2VI79_9SACH|nr:SUMO ligase CST9 [Kazachstania barnettii]CAB4256166.1 similar to Saccharomyces cerevisiae YLR394W CST9 SUMO E3 ligase [Kazachstania barnettii]CAD1784774.1 similar to Saccharomyces cerevisiae YLR394W CST9 SUMO E3 ligase [Kazachstania barnettii]